MDFCEDSSYHLIITIVYYQTLPYVFLYAYPQLNVYSYRQCL